MLPKNFYDEVEKPGFLKHILYGDSVSKDMKTLVQFKGSHAEYLTFEEIWNKLILTKPVSIENDKEYILINDEIKTLSYNVRTDSWNLSVPIYIMRHKINKEIIRLNFTNLAHLDVTEDHSMLDYDSINRNLKIKKPNDMTYVPVIMTNFSINESEINHDYLLLGLRFEDVSLVKLYEELQQDHIKLISFFVGYWVTNGSFSDDGQTVIASPNKTTLEQIQSLLMIIGIYSHLKIDENTFELSTNLNQELFKLLQQFEHLKNPSGITNFKSLYYGSCFGDKNRENSDCQVCRKSRYAHLFQIKPIKIISKERIKYNDYVFDWCIPETQNFIANGCLVHNTDSLYIAIPVRESDKLTSQEKLKIADKVAEDINSSITRYLNEYFLPKSNISPDYNVTYFKTEMLMSAIMFLDVKKTYAYKLEAKKGKILSRPEVKYTGMQVVRSNAAKMTQDLLREIVENVALNDHLNHKEKLSKTLQIIDETYNRFLECVENLDLSEISTPGKWSKQDAYINGMKLYNFIMGREIFSFGAAGNFIYCIFKNPKMFQKSGLDMTKIKGIVIPQVYDKLALDKKFNEYQIEINKVTQWDTLYSTTVNRIVDLVKKFKVS
mgnify:CR=1 FL=1